MYPRARVAGSGDLSAASPARLFRARQTKAITVNGVELEDLVLRDTGTLQGGLESTGENADGLPSAAAWCSANAGLEVPSAAKEIDSNKACRVALLGAASEAQALISSQSLSHLFAHHILKAVCLHHRVADVDEAGHFDRLHHCAFRTEEGWSMLVESNVRVCPSSWAVRESASDLLHAPEGIVLLDP